VHSQPVPWPDVDLPARLHLNRRRVPVPSVPRKRPEHVREIRRRRALLPMHLRRDPGTRGLELRDCVAVDIATGHRLPRRRLHLQDLHRRQWRTSCGHRRHSSTSPSMTTTITARLRPSRRLHNPSLGYGFMLYIFSFFKLCKIYL
jgi:hypothetical protein